VSKFEVHGSSKLYYQNILRTILWDEVFSFLMPQLRYPAFSGSGSPRTSPLEANPVDSDNLTIKPDILETVQDMS